MKDFDTIVIGGGQSALACGYYLKKLGLSYILLDDQATCGGGWLHTWESLTLFSPAEYSSLPGWMMPQSGNQFPTKFEVINYLCAYEQRYKLSIQRPVKVTDVFKQDGRFSVVTDHGNFYASTVISATGSWQHPFVPTLPGIQEFAGEQLHSAAYKNALPFRGKRVLVVGGGNSGAQLLAEVSRSAETKWATLTESAFLPDDVDGRVLFNTATAKYHALEKNAKTEPVELNLGNIVMVPGVKEARNRNVLHSAGNIKALTSTGVVWDNDLTEDFDTIIWCTGFKPALAHLNGLVSVNEKGHVALKGQQSVDSPGLWLVGYGNWTGFASATLIGVGRSARSTVTQIAEYLNEKKLTNTTV